MNNSTIVSLDAAQIELTSGGVGDIPENPNIQDLIDLSETFDEATRWRLGIED